MRQGQEYVGDRRNTAGKKADQLGFKKGWKRGEYLEMSGRTLKSGERLMRKEVEGSQERLREEFCVLQYNAM
jgi:hypothetical protein